jgi:hypothetical protein
MVDEHPVLRYHPLGSRFLLLNFLPFVFGVIAPKAGGNVDASKS